jgi:hypothetical protein
MTTSVVAVADVDADWLFAQARHVSRGLAGRIN